MAPYFVAGDAPADQQMRQLDEVFHLAMSADESRSSSA